MNVPGERGPMDRIISVFTTDESKSPYSLCHRALRKCRKRGVARLRVTGFICRFGQRRLNQLHFGGVTDMRLLAERDEIRCLVDVRTFRAAECARSTLKFERDLQLAARSQMYVEAIETWGQVAGDRHPRATCLRRRRTPSRAARLSGRHDILI